MKAISSPDWRPALGRARAVLEGAVAPGIVVLTVSVLAWLWPDAGESAAPGPHVAVLRNPAPSDAPVQTDPAGPLATDFDAVTLAGDSIQLSDLRGAPVLLAFWASWCRPCADELMNLNALSQEWPASELRVLAVNYAESPEAVADAVQQLGVELDVVLDDGRTVTTEQTPASTDDATLCITGTPGVIAQNFGVRGVPSIVALDAEGRVIAVHHGALSVTALDALAAKLVAGDPG